MAIDRELQEQLVSAAMQRVEERMQNLADEAAEAIAEFAREALELGAQEEVAEELYKLNLRAGAFLTPFVESDGQGNMVDGFVLNHPYEYAEQSVVFARALAPDGTVRNINGQPALRIVYCAGGRKADGADLTRRGGDCVFRLTGHALLSGPRDNAMDGWTWQGVFEPDAVGGGGGVRPLPRPQGQLFSDVPTDHPLYAEIQTLVGMGAVGGYADGTFRPGASLTRGQAAAIIVRALRYLVGQ